MKEDTQTEVKQSPGGRTAAQAAVVVPQHLFVRRRQAASDLHIITRPSISYWQDAWMRLRRNKVAIASAAYIVCLIVAALAVPPFLDYSHDEQEIWNKHASPTLGQSATVVEVVVIEYEPERVTTDPSLAESPTDVPQSPQSLEVVGDALTTGVILRWAPVAGIDGYRIYRSISEDTLGIPLEDIPPDQVTYRDTTSLTHGVKYYYSLFAFNAFGDSAEPVRLQVTPGLALPVDIARTINPDVKVGDQVLTRPHYLGTDYLGRDLLARILIGTRVSLFIGIVAPALYILFGIVFGSISGYFGGLLDDFMMRVTDIVATVPELLVVILLQVMMGSGISTLIIALVAVAWARSARQIRGEVLRLREMEFISAAKVLGTGFSKVIGRHLIPNVMGTVLVLLTLAVPGAIFTEAFLSFIGLGIEPPMTSWGIIAKEGARVFLTYPHELLIPSALICLTMLAFNLLGDGLRDALDPKLRGAH